MLYDVFYTILKMSCVSSVIAILLLFVKYIFQKLGFPRKIMFLLWTIIAFRLICPVSVSTDISLFNMASTFDKQNYTAELHVKETTNRTTDVIRYKTIPSENNHSQGQNKMIQEVDYTKLILPTVWLLGMCAMLLFAVVSFALLKRRLRFAIKLKENVYTAENIPTSFVFGIFRPKIFIPEITKEQDLENIIVHEKTHIKRADHITKIIAYMLLSVHWFNPLIWIMFKMFADDMEFACDEDVMTKIGIENKKEYLNTLLVSSVNNKKTILLYNVCFSANPTKRRVKNIIQLKTHSKGIAVTSVIICLLAAIVFGTNAAEHKGEQATPITQANFPLTVNANAPIDKASFPETEAKEDLKLQTAIANDKQIESVDNTVIASNNTINSTPKANNTPIPQTQVSNTVKNNTPEIPEITQADNIDFMQTIFDDDVKMSNVEQDLNSKGITAASGKNIELGKNYVLNDYSYEDNCSDTVTNVSCDKDGNISLYFDVNAENLVDVTFTDSVTKEVVAEFGILANDVNSYSFTGFNNEKSYDVTVQGKTNSTWKIEGQYIVY